MTAAAPSAAIVASPVSEGVTSSANHTVQESPQAKFANAHSYVVPAPSFTYNAINSNTPGPPVIIQPSTPQAPVGFPGNQMILCGTDTSNAVAQASGLSSASAVSQSVSLPLISPSSSTLNVSSSPNLGPSASQKPNTSSLFVTPGCGAPWIPTPAGLVPSASMNLPPTAADFTSSIVQRPTMQTVSALNPLVQQQAFPTHPSLPSMAAAPQGLWLQQPQMGGAHRPPFSPYPTVFPGPFPLPAHGISRPLSLPDSHPPGVTPIGPVGLMPTSSASGNQLVGTPGLQTPLPPGIDIKSHLHDVGTKGDTTVIEASDAWTVHKTDVGAVYYYNAVTGVSTYEKPIGFKGEPEKVLVQPTPVSMENLAGTDWALISTNDGKKYYYNNKTKSSSWQIPSEVTELRKKQEVDLIKEHATSVSSANVSTEKGSSPIGLNAPAITTAGRDAIPLRTSSTSGASSALDLIKKKLQDSGAPVTSPPAPVTLGIAASDSNGSRTAETTAKGSLSENNKDKLKDSNGDGNVSDSSLDSEDEENAPTKEDCIIQFKEMLKERGVAPFSKWEKELPKIVFDPRFKAIPSHSARRALFERYVKTRAEEERKEKRAAQKAAIEGFKQLLEEASEDIDHNMDYQTFRKTWGNDPRFEALDRKEREQLLNERVLSLKKAVQEKAEAERAAAAASFKSLLRERGDITVNSRWSRVKDSLRNDLRYKSVKHEDREVLFNQYLSELKAAEEASEQVTKGKRDEEDKLKERERELRKRKEREEQEMEKVRHKVRRKEAVASFQALLVETIKDSQASWTESKPKLEKDPQRRATNPDLDPSETEKLFRDHIKMLHERCIHDFRAVLAEVITAEAASRKTEDGKTVLDSWSTAKRLLKPDSRYNKMPRKERESLWRRHAEEIMQKQKSTLDQRQDKHTDSKARSSAESGRHLSVQRSTRERR